MTTQVLLVSAQAAPNLLAALDPELKPQAVVLLVTAKMAERAEALEKILRESGIRTQRKEIRDEHDFSKLEESMLAIAAESVDADVALNLTGGTKLMALAAQSIGEAAGWSMFYVDLDTDEIIWLGKPARRQPLNEQLRLRHYLGGYGFTLEQGIQRPPAQVRHSNLLRTLVTQIGSLEKPLGQLNYLAQQAEGSLRVRMTEQQADSVSLQALLRNFEEAGVLAVKNDGIDFASSEDRFFANGGWLETYVFQTLTHLHGELGIRDKAMNLTVVNQAGLPNELDITFLAHNRLFIIECKTARMDGEGSNKANDALFKLSENCRRIGGLGTRGMLASYRKLRESELKLARALGIEVVAGGDLVRLEEKIKLWIRR